MNPLGFVSQNVWLCDCNTCCGVYLVQLLAVVFANFKDSQSKKFRQMFLHRRLVKPVISQQYYIIYRAALKKAFDILKTKHDNGMEFVDFAAFMQIFAPKICKTQLYHSMFSITSLFILNS